MTTFTNYVDFFMKDLHKYQNYVCKYQHLKPNNE